MARSLQQAQQELGAHAQSRFGKTLDQNQWNQLGGAVGFAGGDVSDDMFNRARGLIDQQFGTPAPQNPAAPQVAQSTPSQAPSAQIPAPPPQQPQVAQSTPLQAPGQPQAPQGPTAPSPRNAFTAIDPNATLSVQDAQRELERMIGRPLTPQEQQEAMKIAGVTGGSISGQQFNLLMEEAARRTPGGQFQAWNPTPTAGAPAPGAPTAPATPTTGNTPVDASMWAKLNQLINQQPSFDPTRPENSLQLHVNRLGNQRAAERRRSAAAERAAQTGTLNSGGFDVTVDQILADQGMADTSFEAQLARDSVNRDRAEMMQALGIGAGLTGQGMQHSVQRELAALDAELRREGLSLQELLGKGQLGNNLLGLFLNTQLGNDKLAFDYANLERLMNENAISSLFGR